MNNDIWLGKKDIISKCRDKKVVFWGNGEWVEKTIKLLNLVPTYIIDNNKSIQGHYEKGVKIIDYKDLIDKENYFIIITTGSFKGLVRELKEKSLIEGEDFVCSPVLNNLKIRDEIIFLDKNILFSVPAPACDKGGVYVYNTKTKNLNQIFSGKSRGLAKSENYICLGDEIEGIILFDHKLNIVNKIQVLDNSIAHGVSISEKHNKIFMGNSGRDSVSIFDLSTGKHLDEIKISDKFSSSQEAQHNVNDVFFDENTETLLISMFSFTGNWRKGVYDGGVLEYDLKTRKINGPIIENMWMPHSIQIIDNNMVLLDSMRGDLYKTNNKIIGNFDGFIRGIDKDDKFFYIAQSSHRYFDRLKDISLNISLNCGIYIFDENTKASMFHSFPEIENIHSVIAL
ncbi:hypothetical protein M947_11125 [Sulfurimonas hongkongensis]|uniref:Conserved hypothetical protein CHP03032 domain-containing protein n=1 Tax=Sulfurimonas hongkongensis TaxID=1172190 RepID=T0J8V4_9BACT|nr:DUF4915 domain-containing protein [Sulfurimonas hongkongensis]EQB34426.1 hypothetical protein M947_11125 [Sulfurimonas hongkongensis]